MMSTQPTEVMSTQPTADKTHYTHCRSEVLGMFTTWFLRVTGCHRITFRASIRCQRILRVIFSINYLRKETGQFGQHRHGTMARVVSENIINLTIVYFMFTMHILHWLLYHRYLPCKVIAATGVTRNTMAITDRIQRLLSIVSFNRFF